MQQEALCHLAGHLGTSASFYKFQSLTISFGVCIFIAQPRHVETVCLLSKLSVEHHIEVELNLDEMDSMTAKGKVTYEEIKAYVKEQTGLQVSNLYIAQVKRKCGIIERVNYNFRKATRRMNCLQSDSTTAESPEKNAEQFSQVLPKAEDSRQPKCPPEKEKAIKAALKHFRMI